MSNQIEIPVKYDKYISITKQNIYKNTTENEILDEVGIELAIKNISGETIDYIAFDVEFLGISGNVLQINELELIDLKSDTERSFVVKYSGCEMDKVESSYIKVAKMAIVPEPIAIGDEKIKILKHSFAEVGRKRKNASETYDINLSVMNNFDKTVATITFEACYFDIQANVVDRVKHNEVDIEPGCSRRVIIKSLANKKEGFNIKSYEVRVVRVTTADEEKVQLRRCSGRTTKNGEEITIIAKNISDVKVDAAVFVTFYDYQERNIGSRALILRNMDPRSVRQSFLLFKPREGDKLTRFSTNIAEIVVE